MLTDLLGVLQEKDHHISSLQHQLSLLKRSLYGRKRETIDPDQIRFVFAELQAAIDQSARAQQESQEDEDKAGEDKKIKKKGHGRKPLPPNLPRKTIDCPVPDEKMICEHCQTDLKKIGEDVSEQLEYVPASFLVKKFVRHKYACPNCHEGVVMGDLPHTPIDGGLAGPGLLAHVAVSKYADHLPLTRLHEIFLREGINLAKSTLCGWIATVASLLTPIHSAMAEIVRQSKVIWTDDTPVKVQDPALRKKTRQGRIWVYVGDQNHPFTVYDYTPNRKRDGPKRFLKGFSKYLQADAYTGYDAIYAEKGVAEVACWAHARRKFYDAQDKDPAIALTALAYIKQLYNIERDCKAMSANERRAIRQNKAKPILKKFHEWLEEQRPLLLPQGPMANAIGYALNQWRALKRYLSDGDLSIDNNAAERALRKIAVGRRNWTFFGSDSGGKNAAILYSIITSCKRQGVNPFAYIRDLLVRIDTHPASRIRELLPDQWSGLVAKEDVEQVEAAEIDMVAEAEQSPAVSGKP